MLATPFLFYGLEFWEHMPAVALAALATAMVVETPRPQAPRALAAGALFGLATLLRPEAGWFAAAVLVAARVRHPPLTWRSIAWAAVGGAAIAAPIRFTRSCTLEPSRRRTSRPTPGS